MGLLRRKNEWGEYRWRKPNGEHVFWFGMFCGMVATISLLVAHGCVDTRAISVAETEELEFNLDTPAILDDLPDADGVLDPGGSLHNDERYLSIEEPPVILEPLKTAKIIKYVFRMESVDNQRRLATTYSKWDSEKERKGIYANQKFANYLNIYERRIRTKHYGVALCLLDARFHNRLIQLPNGTWTHKYRVHVPHYNPGPKPSNMEASNHRNSYMGSDVTSDILSIADCKWFSVPRDRMSHGSDRKNHNGRCDYCEDDQCIDVLHTGYEAAVKNKQRKWMNNYQKYMDIGFWEIACFAVYDNGTERKVQLREAYSEVIDGHVYVHEVAGGGFVKSE